VINQGRLTAIGSLAWLMLFATLSVCAQDHSKHGDHRMTVTQSGMVMNENTDTLPRDCKEIRTDYEFEVLAGTEFAGRFPGSIFSYDLNEFEVEPCSRIRVNFVNRDETRHQWMVHGLPRYLYPGGMFHLEAAGGATVSGSFIVPGDKKTYLVHCDITQHMEKGMKAQLKVGGGSGDLWAVPGVSRGVNRASYLPIHTFKALLALFIAIPVFLLAIRKGRSQ